ncbi:hypothetical protein XENOCAPTIV_014372, partial [Xenoophorus captivus]
ERDPFDGRILRPGLLGQSPCHNGDPNLFHLPDEQEALNSIMQDLAELHRSSRPATFLSELAKPKASSPKNQVSASAVWETNVKAVIFNRVCFWPRFQQNDVRVKFEFKGEKRILQFPRPLKLEDLKTKAKVAFGQATDLHYTNNEVPSRKLCVKQCYMDWFIKVLLVLLQLVIPLTTQDDLDKAVELLDRSVHMKSLKILLVLQVSNSHSVVSKRIFYSESTMCCCFFPLQIASSNMDLLPSHEELDNTGFRALTGSHSTDRSSPPPGYIPDALQQVARNGSFTSINSEGEFIPESMDQVPARSGFSLNPQKPFIYCLIRWYFRFGGHLG